MKKIRIFLVLISAAVITNLTCVKVTAQQKDVIQMAILLDTSGSMDGLINQAKSQLWKIVNELASAKKNGAVPELQVALYEYGNDSNSSSEGYVRQIIPLTTDLDRVSEELFKLTTNGGEEYCGEVIDRAVKALSWSRNRNDLKMIFIAGNEPFSQGSVDYKKSVRNSVTKGIIVNTIFCGDAKEGINTFWKDGADLGDGKYITINQDEEVAYIEAPQDAEIAKLGQELNSTYLAFGAAGASAKKRQEKQDANASEINEEVAVQRSIAKASVQYKNSTWDMVDAVKENEVKIEDMKDSELPDEMKGMNAKERKAYVEKMDKKRTEIQARIKKLSDEREKYIAKERAANAGKNTLDEAVLGAVREQANKKNYNFSK
ncbi:MAG: VWA domain-containing protein [Spirochaetes bacterium]|nr:VWA domain-containing protein [Spirochaetota bacterium]